jgi:S-adenosylmethionine decarboxylase
MRGLHLTADLHGCAPHAGCMHDPLALRQLCLAAVQSVGLNAVGELFHRFEPVSPGAPAGITGVVLLAESHLAVHTWPEQAAVTVDAYVCNLSRDHGDAAERLLQRVVDGFAPQQVLRQRLDRGDLRAAASSRSAT